MKLFLGTLFLIVGLNLTVFAQQEEPTQLARPRTNSSPTVYSNDSESLRQDKQFQATGILVGIGPSISMTSGLQFGYFLNSSNLLSLEVTRGRLSTNDDTFDDGYDITTNSIGVHNKFYVGNSFYIRGGADYRTADVEYTYKGLFSTTYDVTRKFKGKSVALNFQIGNQWQWENFTMGCDWVGYAVPISSSISDEYVSSNTPDYDTSRNKEDQDDLVKEAHITLVRFYLGASF